MKRIASILVLIPLLIACGGAQPGMTSIPGQGAISVQIVPNPIVARHLSGDTYEFPFDVVVRETGGRPINVTRVTATVYGPGGFSVGRDSWDADRIRSLGYDTSIRANSEVRYRFSPRKSVPDERVFGSLSAELKVEAVDDSGVATSATTVVTVRRS